MQGPVLADSVRDLQAGAVHAPAQGFLDGLVAESRKLPARVWRDTVGLNARAGSRPSVPPPQWVAAAGRP